MCTTISLILEDCGNSSSINSMNGKSSSYFLCQASEGNLFLLNSLKHYVCISSSVRNSGFKTSIPCTALKLLLSLSLLDLTLYPNAPLHLHHNSDSSCTLLKLFINRRKVGRMSVKEKWEKGRIFSWVLLKKFDVNSD